MRLDEIIERSRNKFYSRPNYKIFVDVDDVLADFAGALTKILDEPYSEKKYQTNRAYKKLVWAAIKQYDKSGGKLWLNLDLYPGAMILWNFLKPYHPEILTATGKSMTDSIKHQKEIWIRKHFGNVIAHIVTDGNDKAQYAKPNHILIDDKKDNIESWERAGGTGIIFKNVDNTIHQLKEIL
ncbi:MAG: 5' nucleotidase, NT5C type [Nitrosopumilaceae archaeon]